MKCNSFRVCALVVLGRDVGYEDFEATQSRKQHAVSRDLANPSHFDRFDSAQCYAWWVRAAPHLSPPRVTGASEGARCQSGERQGSWHTVRLDDCLARCERCAACMFVSFSEKFSDCSWFASCQMDKLLLPYKTGHRSRQVRWNVGGNFLAPPSWPPHHTKQQRPFLPSTLAGHSILFIGDSLDRNAVDFACEHFGATMHSYVISKPMPDSAARDYTYCLLRTESSGEPLVVGSFQNFGVDLSDRGRLWTWAYAQGNGSYRLRAGLDGDRVDSHIRLDATKFRRVLPAGRTEPSLVVVQSHLWDLARLWQNLGKSTPSFQPNLTSFVPRWASHVRQQLLLVRRVFPDSIIAWRTAPPAAGAGRNAASLRAMNRAARQLLATEPRLSFVHLLDWVAGLWAGVDPADSNALATIATYTDGKGNSDATHPGRTDSLTLIAMALGILCDHGVARGIRARLRDVCRMGQFPSGSAIRN